MALPFPSTMSSLYNVMLKPLGEAKQVRYLCEKQGNSPAEKSQSKNRTISCMWGREGEVGQNGVTKPDYEKGEKGSIYSGQTQRVKDKVEWKCLSGGVKVSRVRKVSKSGMMSKPKWDEESRIRHMLSCSISLSQNLLWGAELLDSPQVPHLGIHCNIHSWPCFL